GWVVEPDLELPMPEQEVKTKELKLEIAKLQAVLDTPTSQLEAAQTVWENQMKGADADWTVLRPSHYASAGGAKLTLLEDQSILAGGKNPEADTYTIQTRTDRAGLTALRLEVLGDPSF